MNRTIRTALTALALTGLAACGPKHSDADSGGDNPALARTPKPSVTSFDPFITYVRDHVPSLKIDGIEDIDIRHYGESNCADLRQDKDPQEMAATWQQDWGGTAVQLHQSPAEIRTIITASATYLCPDQKGKLSGWGG